MDRRQFTLALAGLGMEAIAGKPPAYARPVGAKPRLLPTLRRYAKWPWPQSVRAAMPLLSPLGDFVPLLVEALADDDVDMRLLAIDLLDELEPDERSLPALISALGDDDPLVRIWAASRVVRFGPRAKAVISALEKWLTPDESMPLHRQEWFRLTAADALVRIDPSRLDILPLLIAALDSHNPLCQLVAAEALGDIGGRAAAVALPKLEELLLAEPDNVWFAEAIVKIDAETASDSRQLRLPGI